MKARLWILVLAVVCAGVARPAAAQAPCQPRYPVGSLRLLRPAEVDSLIGMLDQPESTWAGVLPLYFGDTYTRRFADLIIYVKKRVVRQALIQDSQPVRDLVLRGEKSVYVLVFATDTLEKAHGRLDTTTVAPPNGLRVRLTVEDYQVDPLLSRVVSTIVGKVFASMPEAQPSDTGVADDSLVLHDVTLEGSGHLLGAFRRLQLRDNTWNRIALRGAAGRQLAADQWTTANFANASASRFGFSLAAGATFDARTEQFHGDTLALGGDPVRVNLYLLGHFYVARPELPARGRSFGIVAGTNLLDGSLLDEIVLGASVDRLGGLLGDLGIVAGTNIVQAQAGPYANRRVFKWFAAVEFPL